MYGLCSVAIYTSRTLDRKAAMQMRRVIMLFGSLFSIPIGHSIAVYLKLGTFSLLDLMWVITFQLWFLSLMLFDKLDR